MTDTTRPWYREPFVWLLIGFPLASVVMGITIVVIAERTKDKMSAARRKGRWVGGIPMLGYDLSDKGAALVVNEDEAASASAAGFAATDVRLQFKEKLSERIAVATFVQRVMIVACEVQAVNIAIKIAGLQCAGHPLGCGLQIVHGANRG